MALLSTSPRLALPCSLVAASLARRWLRLLLQERASAVPRAGAAGVEGVRDAAELLLTEVVTNAVIHARTDSFVSAQPEEHRLWVAVKDWSPLLPVAPAPAPAPAPAEASARAPVELGLAAVPTSGRGLDLLDALASSWGFQRAGTGKVVWFALDYRCPPAGR